MSGLPRMKSRPITDEELALAVAGKDTSAFQKLYERHCERVYARLTRLLGPVPDREDVMQQVFLQLYRALPTFRGDSTLSTFLFRITAYVACDYLRKCGRRVVVIDGEGLDELIDGKPTPEDRSRSRQQLETIFNLLQHVKPERRIAFQLVAMEGLSLAAAADQVGAAPKEVKQRVSQARRELVAMLDRAERRGASDGKRM
jgi:RNA polymerase sigma-70 factor, ECF subfamily